MKSRITIEQREVPCDLQGVAIAVSFKTEVQESLLYVVRFGENVGELDVQKFTLMSAEWVQVPQEKIVFDLTDTKTFSDKMYRSVVQLHSNLKKANKALYSVGVSESLKRKWQSDGVLDVFNPKASIEAVKAHSSMFPADTNILVVDDMLTMRKLVVKSLKEMGFSNFIEASNGAEAYEKLSAHSIQLIISDWSMPQTSGLDLLKRVRAEAKTAKIPFILVTAEAEKSQIVEAVQAGVSNYVVKPFTTETLKEKISAVAAKLGY